jgi:hypothetical protein
MDVLAVDLLLLRSLQTPELRLTPGRALMARVMRADGSGRGALNIAGAVIEAELPKHVRAGQELRLLVRSVTAEQVMLSLSHDAPVAQPPTPPAVPLPGGGKITITEQEERGGEKAAGDATHTLTIQYDAPTLGRLDLRFELDPAALQLTVTLPAGEALRQAESQRQALEQTLTDNVDRTVNVALKPRRQPLDLYA